MHFLLHLALSMIKKYPITHAIIPTGKIPSGLPLSHQQVFDAVVLRLISGFYPNCTKQVKTVEGESNELKFQAKGIQVIEPGWTRLYPKTKKDDEQELPEFKEGETGPHNPYIKEGKTKPP